MRFGEFLKTTVLLCAGGASVLVVATLAGAHDAGDLSVVWVAFGWWVIAAALGLWAGRGTQASEAIASLLAGARTQAGLPETAPVRTVLNRLWPLLGAVVVAAALASSIPQVPAVVAGFTILWAFAWRRQSLAVRAIEGRDGARFYVDRTHPLQAIALVRTPGFHATLVEVQGVHGASGDAAGPVS